MAEIRTARQRPGWTLVAVCTAVFMLLLDVTVVVVALGDIQQSFHADLADLQWVIDAYTVPLAGLLLTAATLGDRIGRRRVFAAGLVLFTGGSLACALARSAGVLDLTRAVQGTGGALLFGTALPLLAAAFPDPRRRAGALGAFGATVAAATAIGPLAGGALVDGPGWRWIFLINVPIGALALLATVGRIDESRADRPRRADWPGTVLLTGALTALLLGLIRGERDGWGSMPIVGLLVTAGVLMAAFVAREATAREPMLDLSLLRSPRFAATGFAGFAIAAGLVAATTYLAIYLLNVLGYSPIQAGLRFLPLTVTAFLTALPAARLGTRIAPPLLIGSSLLLAAAGLALMARVDAGSGWLVLLPGMIIAGVGMGIASSAIAQGGLAAVEPARAGMASGVVNTLRQVGIAAGVAVLGVIFTDRARGSAVSALAVHGLPAAQAGPLADMIGSGAGRHVLDAVPASARGPLAEVMAGASAGALRDTLLAATAISLLAAVVAFAAGRTGRPADRRAQPSGSGRATLTPSTHTVSALPVASRSTTSGTGASAATNNR